MTQYTLPLSSNVINLLAQDAGYNVTANGVNFPGGITLTTSITSPLPYNYYDLLAANAYTISINAYSQANTGTSIAQAAFNFANTISGGSAVDNVARITASSASANTIILQNVNVTQNVRLNSIETINTDQNTSITVIQGVDNTQNTRLDSIETINSNQNTSITIIQGVNTWQNSEITSVNQFAQSAYNKANTGGASGIDQYARDTANLAIGIDATQNTRLNSIETVDNNQNTSISIIQGVNDTQNTRLNSIETINTNQNTTISIIQGVDLWQNSQITAVNQYAASAYAVANTANGAAGSSVDSFARTTANGANGLAQGAFNTANGANGLASGAYNTANGANGLAAGAYNTANGANGLASGAYNKANTALANTTGTFSGSLFITGALGVGTTYSATTGEIRATNEITAYYSSDERLKENIEQIDAALYKLRKVRGVMFDWKDEVIEKRGGEDKYFVRKHDTGVIAQEIEQVLPEVVAIREDGYKAVRYEKLAGLIIQAINELADEVEEIKKKIK
jgi:hypothetical protein